MCKEETTEFGVTLTGASPSHTMHCGHGACRSRALSSSAHVYEARIAHSLSRIAPLTSEGGRIWPPGQCLAPLALLPYSLRRVLGLDSEWAVVLWLCQETVLEIGYC